MNTPQLIFPFFCWWMFRWFIVFKTLNTVIIFCYCKQFYILACLLISLRHFLSRTEACQICCPYVYKESCVCVTRPATTKPVALCSAYKNSQESLVLLSTLFRVTGFSEMSGWHCSLTSTPPFCFKTKLQFNLHIVFSDLPTGPAVHILSTLTGFCPCPLFI